MTMEESRIVLHAALDNRAKYRLDIDGLRAVAILSVLAFHAFPEYVPGGLVGVDVFFVISGFLISTIIIEGLQTNSFSFTSFYARRIRRIFPALLVVLATCFVTGWFVLLSDAYENLGKHIAGAAVFISNFILWGEAGYFDNAAATKPLLHLWSLGIEEQFYMTWPAILWLAWRLHLNLLTVILVIGAVSFWLNISMVHHDQVGVFYAPYTRGWELLGGALLAHLTTRNSILLEALKPICNIQSVCGTVLIATGIFVISDRRSFPGWWATLPTLGAALVISAGPMAWLNRTLLSSRPLVFIGLISFPLYLWHWPLLSFARIIEHGTSPFPLRVALIVGSIALAWLTYVFVEAPLRLSAGHRKKAAVLLASMAAVGILGITCYVGSGLNFRFPSEIQYVTTSWSSMGETWRGSCFLGPEQDFRSFASCRDTLPGRPSILLWGDSHAAHLIPGMATVLGSEFNIIQRTASSCPPLIGYEKDSIPFCKVINNHDFDLLLNRRPDKIILAGYWTYYEGWRDKLVSTIAQIKERQSAPLYLVGQVPWWKDKLPDMVYYAYRADQNHRVPTRLKPSYYSEIVALDQTMREMAGQMNVAYISPTSILCNPNGCLTRVGEALTQMDWTHLTPQGSTYVVSRFSGDLR
jgi:peptidoglycan/LPS O-acetylase OafA/YrhL